MDKTEFQIVLQGAIAGMNIAVELNTLAVLN